jgi:hypothetical protein
MNHILDFSDNSKVNKIRLSSLVKICIDCGSINVSRSKNGILCNSCRPFRKYYSTCDLEVISRYTSCPSSNDWLQQDEQ